MIRILRVFVPLLLAAALAPAPLAAQSGSTTDIITGRVTGPGGTPITGATVEATSVETQVTRRATTNADGRYTLVFPQGTGEYRLQVRFVGMAPVTVGVSRGDDEDRIMRDFALSPVTVTLSTVEVRARQAPRGPRERPTPGSTERAVSGDQATQLPVDASDLNAIAALAPGVVGVEGTDTTAAGFSVNGQRPTDNNITLDGLSFGAAQVPQDAVRATRVITNTWDVSRGQFSGGLVASTTRAGTNVPQGSATYVLRSRTLELSSGGPGFNTGYTQNQLSGGFGGPLVRDKLFAFIAAQGRWRAEEVPSLLSADGQTLARVGASPDSVARFLGLARTQGLLTDSSDAQRATNNGTALLRLDWNASDQHTLTVRGDWRGNTQDPTRVSPLALPQTGGTQRGTGGGLMATLTSRFGAAWINELRAYGSTDQRRTAGFLALPAGRVQVASDSASGRGITTFAFGGNPSLPQRSTNQLAEVQDELSWLPGAAAHRLKAGVFFNATRATQVLNSNQLGTFTFRSLGDLEADRPSSFTRTLEPRERSGTNYTGATYLGDTWRHSRSLQLDYGVRAEASRFGGTPAYNPAVESAFGRRTDRIPSDVQALPRVGFSWAPRPDSGGPPTMQLRGGVGAFRSPAPLGLLTAAQNGTGLGSSELQLVCVGESVPTPDWASYAADPSTIPTSCGGPDSAVARSARPNIALFSPRYAAPRTWRASLGLQRRLVEFINVSVDASWSRGVAQPGFRDLNLRDTPQFTLASEGGRPVYAAPEAIVPFTGAIRPGSSRRDSTFNQVLEIGSGLESEAAQLIVSANRVARGGTILQLSYTLTRSRDQSSFTCCSATQGFNAQTTAGDPNVREWAPSDYERRHQLLAVLTRPFGATWDVRTIGRLTSGQPFTPMVSGDVNGDGARNDRAFVFDPSSAGDTAVAAGMARLLAAAPKNVRDCLTSQLGHVASRNSCRAGWRPSLDLQANIHPAFAGLNRRLTISLTTVNLLAGLDQLVHGAGDMHGWGYAPRPDESLLYVRGFDPNAQRFIYAVNERFGTARGNRTGYSVPFQVGVQARYVLGGASPLLGGLGGGGGRGGFGAGGGGGRRGGGGGLFGAAALDPDAFLARFRQLVPNPLDSILALRDSLGLDSAQVARLTTARDSLDTANAALADSVRTAIQSAGPTPDPSALIAVFRPKMEQGRANITRALAEAQQILTPAQWEKVPARVKRTGQRGPGAGRRGEQP